jgi:phosphoserine aminotransferase
MTVHYFSPGPASLPAPVRTQIHHELLDTFGIGVSIMEISHRSKYYEELNAETLALAKRVFEVPDTHSVVFSVCGAQQHFSLVIQHLTTLQDEIAYTDTGIWAHLACQEAKLSGRPLHIVYNGGPDYKSLDNYKNWQVPPQSKYVHITVNNTVYGTEYATIPTFGKVPVVLDMTSSLAARTDIPWKDTALIYASAQKNFGIAGASVVIVRNDILEKSREITVQNHLGRALSYHALFDTQSALNTPPVFSIFAMNRMLKWIEKSGGAKKMEEWSLQKAKWIYDEIDKGFYQGRPLAPYRSRHNFVFSLPTPEQDAHFIETAAKEGLLEIKGYKNTGGIRVSIYNGVSLESAQTMASFLNHYRAKYGG